MLVYLSVFLSILYMCLVCRSWVALGRLGGAPFGGEEQGLYAPDGDLVYTASSRDKFTQWQNILRRLLFFGYRAVG